MAESNLIRYNPVSYILIAYILILCWGKALMASAKTKPQQRKKEESEKLRGEIRSSL